MEGDDNPFWRFSCALYEEPGVAPACLALQDRHDLDVNVLLFCCWAGYCGRALLPMELSSLIATVDPWQREVVRPLRHVRRWLKAQETVPAEAAEALRAQVKAQELEAERLEQELLHAALPLSEGWPLPPMAIANLQLYFIHQARMPGVDDMASLAALVTATFKGSLPPLNALQELQDWPSSSEDSGGASDGTARG